MFKYTNLFILICFLGACTSKPVKVTTTQEVEENTYLAHEAKLKDYFNRLDSIPLRASFGHEPDSMSSDTSQNIFSLILEYGFPKDNTRDSTISASECFFVHDIRNLFGFPERALAVYTGKRDSVHPYLISRLNQTGTYHPRMKDIMTRFHTGEWSETSTDSITSRDSLYKASSIEMGIKAITDTRFVILVDDKLFTPPSLASETEFYSGELLTVTELYDMKADSLLSRKFHYSTNDSILEYQENKNLFMKSNPTPILKRQLIQHRDKTIRKEYNITESLY
ncbi:MAG: hypothetical protein JJ975_09305 [Bacteroidia bacterium]|nr:hypothetical protein [Bacteroidia bacterium]